MNQVTWVVKWLVYLCSSIKLWRFGYRLEPCQIDTTYLRGYVQEHHPGKSVTLSRSMSYETSFGIHFTLKIKNESDHLFLKLLSNTLSPSSNTKSNFSFEIHNIFFFFFIYVDSISWFIIILRVSVSIDFDIAEFWFAFFFFFFLFTSKFI